MKKQNLKKVITIGMLVASMLTIIPTGASASWRQNGTGWWYTEGNSYSRGWRNIGSTWYYFDNNGYMKTGWLNNGGWYYFSPSGAMQTGWIQYGGAWYYLQPNGQMATGNMIIDGKVSSFDRSGKWLGYASSNQNTNNRQQSGITTNNNQQQADAGNNSSTVSQSTQTNVGSAQQNNTANTSTNNINVNSNNNSQGSSNSNGTQGSSNSNSNQGNSNLNNNQGNINLNSSANTVISQNTNNGSTNSASSTNSNNNQAVTSNQANGEFSINDALRMISNYKGVAVTLTPPGPTSGIDGAYEKIHNDGKVGYYIFSYLFNGRRVDNSSGILIFEDGSYKQYKQGHHPSELYADEWIEEKKQHDDALKDFLSHVQPTHDGNYDYNYHGKVYGFTILEGMEQWSLYRIFHAEEFDRDGYHIETADDYLETANIRIN